MEQLIRAATPYNYAMLAFLFFWCRKYMFWHHYIYSFSNGCWQRITYYA